MARRACAGPSAGRRNAMKTLLRIVRRIVVGLCAMVVLVVAFVYVRGEMRLRKSYHVQLAPLPITRDSAAIARGAHLYRATISCALCHGRALLAAGKMNLLVASKTPPFSRRADRFAGPDRGVRQVHRERLGLSRVSRFWPVRWARRGPSGAATGGQPHRRRHRELDGSGFRARHAGGQAAWWNEHRCIHAVAFVWPHERRGVARAVAVRAQRAGQAVRQQVMCGCVRACGARSSRPCWPRRASGAAA